MAHAKIIFDVIENVIAIIPRGGNWKQTMKTMKPSFVRIYLFVTGVILVATALAKLPAIFLSHFTSCMEGDPILGNHQPSNMSNAELLGIAASAECLVVLFICFSRRRWLPCFASALWGSVCVVARFYLMDPATDCGCLGWLAKPGPTTNWIAGLLAMFLAAGGWLAFHNAWRDEKFAKQNQVTPPA